MTAYNSTFLEYTKKKVLSTLLIENSSSHKLAFRSNPLNRYS